ncbi:hypothetical protein IF1G_10590 [Cordyceps javanica]|uniref:Uncharacterized protein n=1 Tax=Cordyceps javanica TaxID=43265 RepID=A0A545UN10_9HYPO|nr:hypothetical protein IF1G_10590 [Cordyceps javanica]
MAKGIGNYWIYIDEKCGSILVYDSNKFKWFVMTLYKVKVAGVAGRVPGIASVILYNFNSKPRLK